MRARYPDRQGYSQSQGVRLYWEAFGEGERTVLFVPPWQIVDSRIWKMQLAYFARYARVVTFDPPGCGRSDRPASGYDYDRLACHTLAVMDAVGAERASLVTLSRSTWAGVIVAGQHPERVDRLVLVASALSTALVQDFHHPRDSYEGWGKFNAHYWRQDYRGFVEWFTARMLTEPHSTKPIEDATAWGLENTPDVLIATVDEWRSRTPLPELLAGVRVPTLIVHGTKDAIRPFAIAEAVHAAIEGSTLVPFEGSGHCPNARDPVRFNLLVRDFLSPRPPARRPWTRAMRRPRRALFISSPIGLGHALRDVAIARELRALHPDLEDPGGWRRIP